MNSLGAIWSLDMPLVGDEMAGFVVLIWVKWKEEYFPSAEASHRFN